VINAAKVLKLLVPEGVVVVVAAAVVAPATVVTSAKRTIK
jgi:hypothetical protein